MDEAHLWFGLNAIKIKICADAFVGNASGVMISVTR